MSEEKDRNLEEEIESLIDGAQPDTTPERAKRTDKQRPIRDIAHLNDSFYKFLSKQLLILMATKIFKDDPKGFITSIVEHFIEGYRRIMLRKYELQEGRSYRDDTEENQMMFKQLAEIEKKKNFEDLERYGEMMKKQLLDLVEINDLDDLDNYNFDPDVDDDLRT